VEIERCWEERSADLEVIWGVNAHADGVRQNARKVERKSFIMIVFVLYCLVLEMRIGN